MDELADKANKLVEAANGFADIAAGGDQAETLAAVRSLGTACGDCHDRFRKEENSGSVHEGVGTKESELGFAYFASGIRPARRRSRSIVSPRSCA